MLFGMAAAWWTQGGWNYLLVSLDKLAIELLLTNWQPERFPLQETMEVFLKADCSAELYALWAHRANENWKKQVSVFQAQRLNEVL